MKRFKIVLIGFYSIIAISLLYGQSSTWQHDDVAASSIEEWSPDVAVEPDGTAHIVFLQQTVKIKRKYRMDIFYANTIGNSLSTPQQITNLGTNLDAHIENPSIALDVNGKVHVAFISDLTVLYLNNVEDGFSTPEDVRFIPDDIFGASSPELDIDNAGKAHIVFYAPVDGVWHIFYATNSSGSFDITDLGDFGFDSGALQVSIDEKDGVVHIAFVGNHSVNGWDVDIYYINNSGGAFGPETLVADNASDQHPTISVDSKGTVHIIHEEFYGSTSDTIFHSENSSGIFVQETAISQGVGGTGHALGPEDEIGILLTDFDALNIIFATNKGGLWSSEEITNPGSGDVSGSWKGGIGIDASGFVHVVGRIRRGTNNKATTDVRYHTNNPNFVPGGGQGEGEMHVERIDMSAKKKGPNWNAVADVLILDQNGPVQNATVSGDWSEIVNGASSANTDAQGVATLNSPKTKSSGSITFTVTDVVKSGFTYDPNANVETIDFITGPPVTKTVAEGAESETPTDFALLDNYPNPFNPTTEIRFQLPEDSHVVVRIFNTLGQEIRTLADSPYAAGFHSVRWDAADNNGNAVSSGIYLYQLKAGSFSQIKKMSLIR